MIDVTLEELRYSVLHDDQFNGDLFVSDIDHILEIAMRKIGFTSLQSPVRLNLENGFFLNISIEEVQVADNAGPGWVGLDQVQMS